MKRFQDVPLPAFMQQLPKDERGYPVPFIVFRDDKGKPHFTINDNSKQALCVLEKRCGICGLKLGRYQWFAGGPKSAFHKHGAYFDGPMHRECAAYALQVCPWLALSRYNRRIDGATLKPEDMERDLTLVDRTQDPNRPELFVLGAVAHHKYQVIGPSGAAQLIHHPARPWKRLEFWQNGQPLTWDEGVSIMRDRYTPEELELLPAKPPA